jgi:uncharacterized protein YrzB (UPF0473 family)
MSTATNSNTIISLTDADGNERHVRVFGNASDPHFSGTSNIKNTISLTDSDGNERQVRVFANVFQMIRKRKM